MLLELSPDILSTYNLSSILYQVLRTTVRSAFFLIVMVSASKAQAGKDYTVGIFLYDGVELLDFSGPGEVFAASGFDVFTLSSDGKKINSQGFVTVKPEYSIETAPKPDIVVFPGGGTRATSENREVLEWIRERSSKGAINMSVCTGARILAEAGILDGLNVTTWDGFTDRLQELLPQSTVLKDTRFVDSGNVVTTAGISAGIDGALHLVARIKGYDEAKRTARYMEYDKWEPEEGRLDFENSLVKRIRDQGLDQALASIPSNLGTGSPPFFEGEMKNLGLEYMEQGAWKKAEEIFKLVIATYPHSKSTFELLSDAYEKQGKFAPITQEALMTLIGKGNIDEAMRQHKEAREAYPGWIMFTDGYMNYTAGQYLKKGDEDTAFKLYTLTLEVYPDSEIAQNAIQKLK